jgi:hypothetical protein
MPSFSPALRSHPPAAENDAAAIVRSSVGEEVERAARQHYLDWQRARQDGFVLLQCRMASMSTNDPGDDDELPTAHALAEASELVRGAYYLTADAFPRGSASVDPRRGIRVEWMRGERHVRLIVPPTVTGRSYVYHEHGEDRGVDDPASARSLAAWLGWLVA